MTQAEPWVEVTTYGPSQGDLTAVVGYYVACKRCGFTGHAPAPLADRKDAMVAEHNRCPEAARAA